MKKAGLRKNPRNYNDSIMVFISQDSGVIMRIAEGISENLPFRVSYFMMNRLIDQQGGNDWVFINILAF